METIKQLTTDLKLSYIKNNYEQDLLEARQLGKSHEEFLTDILIRERENRLNNGIKNRLREAKFPQKKVLEDFKRSRFTKEQRLLFEKLETLDFIRNKENIILISNPGMGKTHYATGLGIKAIFNQMKVLFISVPNLIIELKEALSKHQITQYKRKFEKYDLVILDELGYVSFDKEGSEILFNLISNRINTGSMIVTTNLPFDRWNEIFKDSVLTAAIVDRLAHKSYVINMSGDSYRVEETINWLKEQ
ncbi:MAG: IS21-like element helper ATPase IstB [Erysipelotrichaceae bacterium]|jgi:DNA replication protein DnaC